jgi:ligand-binding sensor domain-containing protein
MSLNRVLHFGLLTVLASCNAQTNSNVTKEKAVEQTTVTQGQAKLIKTQGSNEYQSVTCGIQDKLGDLWFGTAGEGVYKYDGKLFTQYTKKDGLSNNHIWSIIQDKDGDIWFGTTDGICRFDGISITAIQIPFLLRPAVNNNYYNEWSTKNTVWSMLQDKTGKMWFGTGDGVYCYNKHLYGSSTTIGEVDGFTRFLNSDKIINKDTLHLKLVSDMLEDKNGNIWFASGMPPGYEGFCRYDGKTLESFKPKNEGWIRNVIESKNGNLLLATRHYGVWTYEANQNEGFGQGKSFTDYMQPKELINGSLNYILEDHAGDLWVASDYGNNMGDTLGGLWHSNISASNTTAKTFTKITNKEVYFILEDKDHTIWFGTRGIGLYRFDGKTITCFSEEKK